MMLAMSEFAIRMFFVGLSRNDTTAYCLSQYSTFQGDYNTIAASSPSGRVKVGGPLHRAGSGFGSAWEIVGSA